MEAASEKSYAVVDWHCPHDLSLLLWKYGRLWTSSRRVIGSHRGMIVSEFSPPLTNPAWKQSRRHKKARVPQLCCTTPLCSSKHLGVAKVFKIEAVHTVNQLDICRTQVTGLEDAFRFRGLLRVGMADGLVRLG